MDKIVLRTYNRMWHFERKLYAFGKYRLLIPVNIDTLAYLLAGLMITILLLKVFPFLNSIPFIFRYVLLPYGLMKFLTKKKFDGKLPHKFLLGYLEYRMLPKTFSRFENCREYKKGKFSNIAYRGKELINITEMLTNKKGRRENHV